MTNDYTMCIVWGTTRSQIFASRRWRQRDTPVRPSPPKLLSLLSPLRKPGSVGINTPTAQHRKLLLAFTFTTVGYSLSTHNHLALLHHSLTVKAFSLSFSFSFHSFLIRHRFSTLFFQTHHLVNSSISTTPHSHFPRNEL